MLRLLALLLLASPAVAAGPVFSVTLDPALPVPPHAGRLVVAFAPKGEPTRFTDTDPPGQPLFAVDVEKWTPGLAVTVDSSAMSFPLSPAMPKGEYVARAVFHFNRDVNLPTAVGNYQSEEVKVAFDPAAGAAVPLKLSKVFAENVPADTATHKFVQLPSKKLSAFHGRPMVYRFAVVLPADFAADPAKKYPLIVHIGGFGTRYTGARRMRPDPRFVQILLDGAGPFGDPYQVDSANNGPYGDALVNEVIPHVESTFRGVGIRFTTGGSTGGWVSLALQIFYPDTFQGCWSQCPDGVDFRAFELIDIYADANAYVNRFGFERPAKRTIDGDTIFSVRHENRIERVLGRGGRWELSGRDWASWNATFGPRGADGTPKPLWDGETGAIDKSVVDHWKNYDLRRVLERDWPKNAGKLAGKINVWVGDADDYFLNNAVHRFKAAAEKLSPKFDGRILIDMRKGHSSGGWTDAEMRAAMLARAAGK